jgi:hypothetical protein
MQRERTNDGYRAVLSEEEMRHIVFDGDYIGFCLECGADCEGIEPDARKYHCQECHANRVYGIEELMLMGKVRIGPTESERSAIR